MTSSLGDEPRGRLLIGSGESWELEALFQPLPRMPCTMFMQPPVGAYLLRRPGSAETELAWGLGGSAIDLKSGVEPTPGLVAAILTLEGILWDWESPFRLPDPGFCSEARESVPIRAVPALPTRLHQLRSPHELHVQTLIGQDRTREARVLWGYLLALAEEQGLPEGPM